MIFASEVTRATACPAWLLSQLWLCPLSREGASSLWPWPPPLASAHSLSPAGSDHPGSWVGGFIFSSWTSPGKGGAPGGECRPRSELGRREVVCLPRARLLGENECLLNRFVSNTDCHLSHVSDIMFWPDASSQHVQNTGGQEAEAEAGLGSDRLIAGSPT